MIDKLNVNLKLLDEKCMPERKRKGEWWDLKFYQIERIFDSYDGRGDIITSESSINQYFEDSIKSEDYYYCKGDIFRVSLGVGMELPKGYEAEVRLRSGTRKQFNVRLTNHVGTIDNAFNGNNDIWLAEFEAIKDGVMKKGDRIVQFRIVEEQPDFTFTLVDKLGDEDRSGFGSSGK